MNGMGTLRSSKRLRRRTALGSLAIAALVIVGVTAGAGAASRSTTRSAPAPNPNATLTVAESAPPVTLDPALNVGGNDYAWLNLIYGRLIYQDPYTLKLSPGIATKWGYSKNKMQFRMTLQKGVTFQDGTKLDAAAVKYSIDHWLQTSPSASWLSSVKSIHIISKTNLTFNLKSQDSAMAYYFSSLPGYIESPTALQQEGAQFVNHPVGAGPYQLVSYTPNQQLQFKRFDGYAAAGEPKPMFSAITVNIITDQTALTNAITSGQAQFAYGLNPVNLPVLKGDSGIATKLLTATGNWGQLNLNLAIPPLNNRLVRQAIAYGINRQALADAAEGVGVSTPAWQPYPKGTAFYDPGSDNLWPYDPAKAKALLAQAGYPNGLTINGLGVSNSAPGVSDANVIQSELAQIGIKVNWTMEPNTQANPDYNIKKAAPMWSNAFLLFPSPEITYYDLMDYASQYNAGHAAVTGVDTLLNQLKRVYTQTGLLNYIHKLNAINQKNVIYIPTYRRPNLMAYATNIYGWHATLQPYPDLDFLYQGQ